MKVRRTPDPSCYGCRGTGLLGDHPCTCVQHTENCEPEGCSTDCLAGLELVHVEHDGPVLIMTFEDDQ